MISKHKLENANQGNGGYEKWNNMFCIILILPYTLISFGECTKPVFLRVFQNVDIFYEKDIRKILENLNVSAETLNTMN